MYFLLLMLLNMALHPTSVLHCLSDLSFSNLPYGMHLFALYYLPRYIYTKLKT